MKTVSRRRMHAAFTLVELLVSLAVFSLLVVMLVTVVGSVSSGWTRSREVMDNFTKARALLSALDRDLANAVIRPDLPAFSDDTAGSGNGSTDPINFYTAEFGPLTTYSTNARALTYVSFTQSQVPATPPNPTYTRRLLTRMSYSFAFTDYPAWRNAFLFNNSAPSLMIDQSQTSQSQLCDGVYSCVHRFINVDGSFSSTFNPPTTTYSAQAAANPTSTPTPISTTATSSRAIQVSLLILSNEADQLANTLGLSNQLQVDFAAAVPDPDDNPAPLTAKMAWDALLNGKVLPNGKTLYQEYPVKILTGIRTYERIIALNPSAASFTNVQVTTNPDF